MLSGSPPGAPDNVAGSIMKVASLTQPKGFHPALGLHRSTQVLPAQSKGGDTVPLSQRRLWDGPTGGLLITLDARGPKAAYVSPGGQRDGDRPCSSHTRTGRNLPLGRQTAAPTIGHGEEARRHFNERTPPTQSVRILGGQRGFLGAPRFSHALLVCSVLS